MNALFLQSEVADPYALYAERLATQPIFHDEANRLWAIHSYKACKTVLDSGAHIPPPPDVSLLGPPALSVVNELARLSNPPQHEARRQLAHSLQQGMTPVDIGALLKALLPQDVDEFDWVDVCKMLPPLSLLKGLRFSEADIATILPRVEGLAALMRAGKDATQAGNANEAVEEVHPRVARHLQETSGAAPDVAVANLIGLLIQSYDAGRGLLSNALLQMLAHPPEDEAIALRLLVIETLRFDPPIHHTRRILTEDVMLEGQRLEKGSTVLLVLAAANRDPALFPRPQEFNPLRPDNARHLTFGAGMHTCIGNHFSVFLAAEALRGLRQRYPHLSLRQARLDWEALANARLAKRILLGVC